MKKINLVLLVDDDLVSNYLTQTILEEMDVAEQITTALNGLEALSYIKEKCAQGREEECPDVILLDINMPVMDGFEFLEKFSMIKPREKEVAIFMLTSSQYSKDVERARQYEVAGYIEKPLTEEKLEDILRAIASH